MSSAEATFVTGSSRSKRKRRFAKQSRADNATDFDRPSVLKRIHECQVEIAMSDFYKDVMKALDNYKPDFIISYGLGNFSHCLIARYQLGLLLCLGENLEKSSIQVYDPVFSPEEIAILEEDLQFAPLRNNDEGKRNVGSTFKTLFYMPHCGKPLYNNVIWANRTHLENIVILGNSFESIFTNNLSGYITKKLPALNAVKNHIRENMFSKMFRFDDVFNDLAVHLFEPGCEQVRNLDEPFYDSDDEIVLNKNSNSA